MVFEATELQFHSMARTNTKADVLSRKDEVDTMDNNKNVKLLNDKL